MTPLLYLIYQNPFLTALTVIGGVASIFVIRQLIRDSFGESKSQG